MKKAFEHKRWALLWRSENKRDGKDEHFMWVGSAPYLFPSRVFAEAHINSAWAYLKNRPDLKAEPHGWKMPKAVRVKVTIKAIAQRAKGRTKVKP